MFIMAAWVMYANEPQPDKKIGPVPVKHWEFDYMNYGVTAGQGTAYINMLAGVRYNIDDTLFDVGGELAFGATPHDHYDPLELEKGKVTKRTYFMLGPAAHYNFRRGRNASFYVGLGVGAGLGTRNVFLNCAIGPDGEISEEWDLKRYFVAALTPRFGVELFRHFRIGIQVRIPTDGEVTVGPSMSLAIGGGKKDK